MWARRVVSALSEVCGADNVLVEWQAVAGDGQEVGDVLADLARQTGTRLVATTGARMSSPSKQALGDVLAATRLRSSLEEANAHLGAPRALLRSAREIAVTSNPLSMRAMSPQMRHSTCDSSPPSFLAPAFPTGTRTTRGWRT